MSNNRADGQKTRQANVAENPLLSIDGLNEKLLGHARSWKALLDILTPTMS